MKKDIPWFKQSELGVSCKIRNDYSDFDYIDQLSPAELKFLKGFNREYYNADFSHKHRKFHRTSGERKRCYDMNNARNRCIYARSKVRGDLWLFPDDSNYQPEKKETYE